MQINPKKNDPKSPTFCRECRAFYHLFLHKLLGSSELVSHHAQELLALLKYIQVNQRNLHQRIILKDAGCGRYASCEVR